MAGPSRYTPLRKIADGGMAAIYLGVQHGAAAFERPVIIKAIRKEQLADERFREALVDEAQIGMSLNHSNIVQVLDLGMSGGRYFLILELVDGWDLDKILKRAQAAGLELPVPLALHIVAEVCRALGYAHAKARKGVPLGIVHRDVSPHNVMLSEHGEVKLTDFGIAMAAGNRDRTVPGLIKGKVGYMSPEQASGEPLDHRSDLFSLGAVLYLLVTGNKPFAAPTELESLLRNREARYPHPLKAVPALPPEVAALIEHAMYRRPIDRFATAEEMLEGVERVLRSRYQGVGATELKRWLAELASKDHDVPITKLTLPPGVTEVGDDDIIKERGIVLSEVVPSGGAGPRKPPPPPEPTPLAPAAVPDAPRRSRTRLLIPAALIGLAAGAYALRDRWMPPPPPLPVAAPPVDAGAMVETALVDAGAQAATADDAGTAPLDDGGADAGSVEADLTDAGPGEQPEPELADAGPAVASAGADKDPVLSVTLATIPPGATVFVGKLTFGPTPTTVRFRSGRAYDVTFLLAGHKPGKERVYVTHRKNQAVLVTLQKE
jgi:serine/threonine protein kinase